MLIGIVGPCSAGKSALARALRADGYTVKEIRQEHSGVPAMWKIITNPDVLIYLDVSKDEAARREHLDQPSSWWDEEREVRLVHAREHCNLYIDTTTLTPEEVAAQAKEFLKRHQKANRRKL